MIQSINGFLLLDKPSGISSNQAVQKAKKIFEAKKAGHTGCLDVLASGMLPICLNEATKFSDYLMQTDKTYQVKAKLGERTDTFDREGKIIATMPAPPDLTREKLQSLLNEHFKGEIEQIPPMFSAIKHKGKPLYKLAREGIEIERKSRKIHIYDIEVSAFRQPFLEVHIHCSKGTYVRSLIDDFGQLLGCGAHVVELRRLSVGSLPKQMVSLDLLDDYCEKKQKFLLPIDIALSHIPGMQLSRLQTKEIQCGGKLYTNEAPIEALRLYDDFKQFIGLGQITEDGKLSAKRLLKL